MAKKKEAEARVVEAENRMYELMLVLKPDLLESAVTKKLKDFTKFLKENECNVTMEDVWGKRTLAYRIKQFEEGIYVVYNIIAPTTFISELDNHLRIDNEVIRHLLISIENDYKYSKFDEEIEEAPKEEKKAPKKEISKKEESVKEVVKEEPVEEPIEKKEESDVEIPLSGTSKEEVVEEKKEEKVVEEKAEEKEEKEEKVVEEKEKVKEEKIVEEKEKEEIDRSALDSKLDDLLSGDDLNI